MRDPAAQASIRNAPRTSPKSGSDRFVVRRKERAARSAGLPALNRLGRTGRWLLDRKSIVEGEGISREAIGE